jgi:hypothetical protein
MLALLVPFAWTQWALGTDSTCFAYRFRAGDTLLYRIEAQDSIVLQNRPPLVRHRYETLRLVCDSVDSAAGRFWLRLTPVEFLARERQDTLEALRPHSPCLQRTVVLCMDSLGGRHSVQAPAEPLVCPGGAFQLPLMAPLEPECKRIYESWLVQDTVELVENASPAPVLVRTVLARAFPEQGHAGLPLPRAAIRCDGFGLLQRWRAAQQPGDRELLCPTAYRRRGLPPLRASSHTS